ncbi:rhodanese-like domain-containing protein [Sodalinema gerasimenkoae]|uniref:rhodanese-like domain-containing protein n=1 Tax=Sodalinema gerasimenkoae TaxID=2862348 RepID=UPI00135C9E39|nr:rhodanese-like domain-containing protein [Sodalinema gerasimenkoae]
MTSTPSTNPTDRLQSIDPSSLKLQLDAGEILLIDVREPSEHAGEKIAGSQLMPLSRFNPQDIPSDRPFVLHCQTGTRSAQAAQKLFAAGVEQVSHLDGGLNAWKQAGHPTIVNKNAPISIMRQVQIVAGSLILIGTLLGAFVTPEFLFLSGFVGAGLLFAGISNTCMMARLLAKLPYNQQF